MARKKPQIVPKNTAYTQIAADPIAECFQVTTEANLIYRRDGLVRDVTSQVR